MVIAIFIFTAPTIAGHPPLQMHPVGAAGRGQDEPGQQSGQRQVHRLSPGHLRGGLRRPENRAAVRSRGEAGAVGHSGTGAVPDPHPCLLPGHQSRASPVRRGHQNQDRGLAKGSATLPDPERGSGVPRRHEA